MLPLLRECLMVFFEGFPFLSPRGWVAFCCSQSDRNWLKTLLVYSFETQCLLYSANFFMFVFIYFQLLTRNQITFTMSLYWAHCLFLMIRMVVMMHRHIPLPWLQGVNYGLHLWQPLSEQAQQWEQRHSGNTDKCDIDLELIQPLAHHAHARHSAKAHDFL